MPGFIHSFDNAIKHWEVQEAAGRKKPSEIATTHFQRPPTVSESGTERFDRLTETRRRSDVVLRHNEYGFRTLLMPRVPPAGRPASQPADDVQEKAGQRRGRWPSDHSAAFERFHHRGHSYFPPLLLIRLQNLITLAVYIVDGEVHHQHLQYGKWKFMQNCGTCLLPEQFFIFFLFLLFSQFSQSSSQNVSLPMLLFTSRGIFGAYRKACPSTWQECFWLGTAGNKERNSRMWLILAQLPKMQHSFLFLFRS